MNITYEVELNPWDQNQLSALIHFSTDAPARANYVVEGKTTEADFFWQGSDYAISPTLTVVGLYPHYKNTVTVQLESESGEKLTEIIIISTEDQEYGDVLLNLDINILNQEMADKTLGRGWFVTSSWNGYDINGDLRITGLYPWLYGNLKIIDNAIYSAVASHTYDPDLHAFAPALIKSDLAGRRLQTYVAPVGYGFHHDITADNQGNLYILGSRLDNQTDESKLECIIYKYAIATGELLWQRDYSTEFLGATVLDNSDTNDVHFNSLEYISTTNQLMVNSRSSCTIIGLNIDSGDLEWIVDNPAWPVLSDALNLTVINPDDFKYTNGEHAIFVTTNAQYQQYQGENKFVISLFNNNSCTDSEGNELVRPIEEDAPAYTEATPDSLPTIFAIDLNARTVQRLAQFEFTGQRSELTSSVFETADVYCVYFGAEQSFFVFDTDNNIGLSIYNIDSGLGYRGRIFSNDQLRSLVQ